MNDRVRTLGSVKIGSGPCKGKLIASVPLLELDRVTRHPDTRKADREAIRDYLTIPGVAADLDYDVRMGRGRKSYTVVPDEGCNESS